MREVPFTHQVVGLNHAVKVRAVYTDSDAHDEVLGPLDDTAIEAEEV
jgi:hypothetical protein